MVKHNPKNRKAINNSQIKNALDKLSSSPKASADMRTYQAEPHLPAAQQTQWQFGDWYSLQELSLLDIEQHEAKAQLALIVAVAHLQLGNNKKAQPFIAQARQWGAGQELCVRILSSGAHNALGRTALLANEHQQATYHFNHSVRLGIPGSDARLITPIRVAYQARQLGLPVDQIEGWHLLLAQSQPVQKLLSYDQEIPTCPLAQQLMAKLNQLLQQLVEHGHDMKLDGVAVFEQQDPFLSGKLALALAYWITEYPASDARTIERYQYFHRIDDWTQNLKIQTWGISFYLRALHILQQASLLNKCVSEKTLGYLKKQLDWRDFVNKEDYSLKKRPSNFYGLAYSIAYYRYQLGWEGPEHADALLEKITDHYQATVGKFGFSDETQGKGRYDRYSFLLIAEIAHQFREADLPLPQRMKQWLKKSADYVLVNLNKEGDGFQYGRSIGAYGDTAFIEILSAAAWFDVISKEQQTMAYHFCCLTTEKFLTYWWDDKRGSVNLWEDGRITEKYRGKHRILGENFSLLHQHLYVNYIWGQLGFDFENRKPEAFAKWLENLPAATLTWFHKGEEYEIQQAIFTWRDNGMVFNVPLVNGEEYYNYSSYLPVPYSSLGVYGTPDLRASLLVPVVFLKNGRPLVPLSKYINIDISECTGGYCLSWEQHELVYLNEEKPMPHKDISVFTKMYFSPNNIKRFDQVVGDLDNIDRIEIELEKGLSIHNIDEDDNKIELNSVVLKNVRFFGFDKINVSNKKASFVKSTPFNRSDEIGWNVCYVALINGSK